MASGRVRKPKNDEPSQRPQGGCGVESKDPIIASMEVLAAYPISTEAAIRSGLIYGERQANLVIAFFRAFELKAKASGDTIRISDIPPAALQEIGALMQLGVWELTGIQPSSLGLPSSHEAALEFNERVRLDKAQFWRPDAATLDARVFDAWHQRFVWGDSASLSADVVGGDLQTDAAVDAMAHLLWNYRHVRNQKIEGN